MQEDSEKTKEPEKTGKTWTQEEHDAYVKARVDKQRNAFAEQIAEKDARIAELEAAAKESGERVKAFEHERELAQMAAQVEQETGIPAGVLRGSTLDELKAHAEQLKAVIRPYPSINPAAVPGQVPAAAKPTRTEILGIKDAKQRIAAIRENPSLFPELS